MEIAEWHWNATRRLCASEKIAVSSDSFDAYLIDSRDFSNDSGMPVSLALMAILTEEERCSPAMSFNSYLGNMEIALGVSLAIFIQSQEENSR